MGLALDFCVKSTVVDAVKHLPTFLITDGTQPIDKAGEEALLKDLGE